MVTTPDIEIVGEAVIFSEKVAVRVTCPEVITLSESSDVIASVKGSPIVNVMLSDPEYTLSTLSIAAIVAI